MPENLNTQIADVLALHNDDDQQDYPIVLQRLHAAIAVELGRLQTPLAPVPQVNG